jgi:hypothetical protein
MVHGQHHAVGRRTNDHGRLAASPAGGQRGAGGVSFKSGRCGCCCGACTRRCGVGPRGGGLARRGRVAIDLRRRQDRVAPEGRNAGVFTSGQFRRRRCLGSSLIGLPNGGVRAGDAGRRGTQARGGGGA